MQFVYFPKKQKNGSYQIRSMTFQRLPLVKELLEDGDSIIIARFELLERSRTFQKKKCEDQSLDIDP